MPLEKAVILARGRGTRMRQADGGVVLNRGQQAAADAGIKAMIPIERPFLDYVLSSLADAGFRQVCLVIGPEHDVMRDYYGRRVRPKRLEIQFAVQREARGTADAVVAAESFLAADPFLMLNGDNFYPRQVYEMMRNHTESAVALFEREALIAGGNIPAERVAKYAVGEIDDQGFLRRIIEKPVLATLTALGTPLWVSMNVWRFTPSIFQACRSISPSVRGEYEIVSAVQYAIDVLEEPFRVEPIHAPVWDLSTRSDIATVSEKLRGMEVQL
jgi:glucose-1-phosphate thymidylyltransferase